MKKIFRKTYLAIMDCMQDALDMIDEKKVDVDFMVTHHFPFDKTKDVFGLVANYNDGVIKAIIDFEK
ncbi:MAG: hypothetical protein MUO22_04255 [Sedimentisphaerales bacterium]|nr:hypothetical protein [Sedimentisphaerales bacterium]